LKCNLRIGFLAFLSHSNLYWCFVFFLSHNTGWVPPPSNSLIQLPFFPSQDAFLYEDRSTDSGLWRKSIEKATSSADVQILTILVFCEPLAAAP